MKSARVSPALLALALALALVLPVAAHADGFVQVFSVPGWNFVKNLGNTDADPNSEMLMVNKAAGYYAIFDVTTAALEFPIFAANQANSSITTIDYEGDGRNELVINLDVGGAHHLFGVWHFTGGTYLPYFSISDPNTGSSTAHLRSTTTQDLIEFRTDDVIVRDIPTGNVVWQASVNFPGWIPSSPPIFFGLDLGSGGTEMMLVTDLNTSIRAYRFTAGTFVQSWSRAGKYGPSNTFNSDADVQPEIALRDFKTTLPQSTLVVDALTGVSELDLSGFFGFTTVFGADVNGDGRDEITVTQEEIPNEGVTNRTASYRWNGSGYLTLFNHTEPVGSTGVVDVRLPNQLEYMQILPSNIRLRDDTGQVFFDAATALPGWAVALEPSVVSFDVDHDGILELLIYQGTKAWMVGYRGTMQVLWSLTGAVPVMFPGNTDADPQDELVFADTADQSFSLYDGLTGALAQHWPQYTLDNSIVNSGPWEGNGRSSLLFFRNAFNPTPPATPLPTRMYRWNGSGYSVAMSFEDSVSFIFGEQHRDATHWELVEWATNGDLILRDAVVGNKLFQASASIAGWPGLDVSLFPTTESFVYDPRGSRRTAVNDLAGMRMIAIAPSLDAPPLGAPGALRLLPSMPNPFRATTTLRFESPRAGKASLKIYDAAGRVVRRMELVLEPGLNSVGWDGLDDAGRLVSEGMLFYELRVAGSRESMKLVRLR